MVPTSAILCIVCVATSTASDPDTLTERVKQLELEVEALRLTADEAPVEEPQTTQTTGNVFNPTISLFGSGLYRFDHRAVEAEEGDRIDNTFNVREFEIDFRAAVDPFADAVAIFAFESEVPGRFEAGLEEGYVTVKRLPIPVLDDPPLGLALKLGRFRTEIGRINRLHLHDLPHVFRPLVVETLFGEEGYIGNGASAHVFIPTPWDNSSLEFTAEALAGGGITLADSPPRFPAFVGNLRSFSTIAEEHNLDLSLILSAGRTDQEGDLWSTTYSADFLYKWKPLRAGEYRSFLIGGQFFYSRGHFLFLVDEDGDGEAETARVRRAHPFGYFAFVQGQLTRAVHLGVRWDDTRLVEDDDVARRAISGYLTLYASEFLRFRFGYEHRFRSDEAALNSAFAELTFIFGAHPPEPFWVNR